MDSIITEYRIMRDASGGHGHCWRDVDIDDIPAHAREVIEGEIIDGARDSGAEIVGGQHYRWEPR